MAQAVQQVNPDAKLGIGPPIKDGFYYDFDVQTPFTPEDLAVLDGVQVCVGELADFVGLARLVDRVRAEIAADDVGTVWRINAHRC